MNMFVELAWHALIIGLIPLPFVLGAGLEILWSHRAARRAAAGAGRPREVYRQPRRRRIFAGFQPAPQH